MKLIDSIQFSAPHNDKVFGLDPGHGGMVDGVYQIRKKGSKQYKHPNYTFYEGVFNRDLVNETEMSSYIDGSINCVNLSNIYGHREKDFSLPYRCDMINQLDYELKKEGYNLIGESVHGNAGKGTGVEVFTSVGDTPADPIAEVYAQEYIREFPEEKFRSDKSDGDLDKESHFYILKNTTCPMILTENWFFDRYVDAEKMRNPDFRKRIISARIKAMKRIAYSD